LSAVAKDFDVALERRSRSLLPLQLLQVNARSPLYYRFGASFTIIKKLLRSFSLPKVLHKMGS